MTGVAATGQGFSHELPLPASVLAIVAHPDDAEFQCGATLAKWADRGAKINYLVLTDGSKGTWDVAADIPALIATREHEQRAAADVLGAGSEITFLGKVDGELQSDLATRSEVAYWIRHYQPDVVLGHDPWKRYRLHPDHRHAGWLAVDGVVAARDPFFFPEHGKDHHRPSALLLFEADQPDHLEDVAGYADTKVAALLEHASQFRSTHFIDGDDDGTQLALFRDRIISRLEEHASLFADSGIRMAEAFKAIRRL